MTPKPHTLYFRKSCLGDDLGILWAAAAAYRAGLTGGLSFYFEREEARSFFRLTLPRLEGVTILERCVPGPGTTVVRMGAERFAPADVWRAFRRGYSLCSPYFSRYLKEYGNQKAKRSASQSAAFALGLATGKLRVWPPRYDELYNGWQELALPMGFSPSRAQASQPLLARQWGPLRTSLREAIGPVPEEDRRGTLIFPGAGSYQRFSAAHVDLLRSRYPGALVAAHRDDPMDPVDIRYGSLEELMRLVRSCSLCVTNDSVSSHMAQFFAERHILICTRARPVNVCFPGSATHIIDLGEGLTCRPCHYYPRSSSPCPAGFDECKALERLPATVP